MSLLKFAGPLFGLLFAVLSASAKDVVVFVCAHPDDLAGPGGTAILLGEKYDLHVIDYTHGEGGCGEAGFRDGSTKMKRMREEEAACRLAGATLHWLDEPNGHREWGVPYCAAGTGTCERLSALLKELNPRALILHWPVDNHPDHVMSAAATFRALVNIGRGACGRGSPEIYFQEQTTQSRTFVPSVYVDITSVVDRKDELIRQYVCQDGEAIARRKREDAVFRGRRADCRYAEAFAVMDGTVPAGRGIFDELPARK